MQAPGSHRQYPEETNQSDDHPEENPNPDIRAESMSQEPEKERTEAKEEHDAREPIGNRNERSEKEDDQSEERSKEIGGETPTQTRPLDERTSHVPGGAWLSQVRSCLRLSYFPLWSRNRSDIGMAGEGPEERAQENE
ncbi:hypothetical protein NDU88_002466 [Pleurodeles waltl]|uniref:Uncharacterized protein n=1 Tax=Pleurodeles waltl TaxID=8319 RepID=A0AAV7VCX7_PLEWA|nr:hypothetical protein NDU88_002466 [Pleurodeles waltl]